MAEDSSEEDHALEFKYARMGACAASWTVIESASYIVFGISLGIPASLFEEVATRIHGYDGIIELTRKGLQTTCLGRFAYLPKLIEPTLAAAKELKIHRDNIVHTSPDVTSARMDKGKTLKSRGRVVNISISLKDLRTANEHLSLVAQEYLQVARIMAAFYRITDPMVSDKEKVQPAQDLQDAEAQLQVLRKARLKLPRLPSPQK